MKKWRRVLKEYVFTLRTAGWFVFLNLVLLITITLAPNLSLVSQIARSSLNWTDRLITIFYLQGSLLANHDLLTLILILVTVLLFSLNILLLVGAIKQRQRMRKRIGAFGFGGLFSGLLGIGCASCGSLLLPILGSVFGGSLLAIFPFHGQEILLLGIGLLIFSNHLLVKHLA